MLENLHPRRSTANLKELGIEAIVNAQRNVIHRTPSDNVHNYEAIVEYYGLPVRKKE